MAQDRPSVEHYIRHGEQWTLTVTTDFTATVHLPSIGCDLRLSDVYSRVPDMGRA